MEASEVPTTELEERVLTILAACVRVGANALPSRSAHREYLRQLADQLERAGTGTGERQLRAL
jgi:hypothetical protein